MSNYIDEPTKSLRNLVTKFYTSANIKCMLKMLLHMRLKKKKNKYDPSTKLKIKLKTYINSNPLVMKSKMMTTAITEIK